MLWTAIAKDGISCDEPAVDHDELAWSARLKPYLGIRRWPGGAAIRRLGNPSK